MRIARALVPQQAESRRRRTIAIVGTRMPSGHVCTPCTDAPWPHADRPTLYVRPARSARRAMAALWPHARACAPRSEVAALTRRAHPLKTPGVMPGQSLEARTAAISQGLCRCVRSSAACPVPNACGACCRATEPSHSMLSVREVGAWRGMEAAAARRATSLRSELTLRYC